MSEIYFTYLSGPDIALGAAMLEKAKRLDLGQRLRYAYGYYDDRKLRDRR